MTLSQQQKELILKFLTSSAQNYQLVKEVAKKNN